MGNTFATLMLFLAPIAVVVLFRYLSPQRAFVISIVGGYLILPNEPTFNLPMLPTYGKAMAVALPALVMLFLATREKKVNPRFGKAPESFTYQPGWIPRAPLICICFIGLLVSPLVTALNNEDPLSYIRLTLPGLTLYDAAASIMTTVFMVLPFLLARKFLAQPEDQKFLIAVFCVAALLYSLPTLWEVRMSPRLNAQIYGFFVHDWRQHLRGGGFRPMVFLEHGLRIGVFFSLGILAAAITSRISSGRLKRIAPFAVFWLLFTLGLSKNLGALLIVLVLLPVAFFLKPRSQLLVAAAFSGIVLLYPMMRAAHLVPLETITETIGTVVSSDRISSLNFRIMNEEALLERAEERPLFGWGGWGRARVRDYLGRDISVTDGTWIIEFGETGWLGYLARFGLLTLPVLLLAFRRSSGDVPMATSGLALLLCANLIDLLPNSGLTPLTWLMAGALAGRLETAPQTAGSDYVRAPPSYSRTPSISSQRPALSRNRARQRPSRGVE